jgi:hypothetical protein
MIAWGRMIADGLLMNGMSDETPLMRMFRIEYSNEYRQMKRLGCEVTDSTIRSFLKSQR